MDIRRWLTSPKTTSNNATTLGSEKSSKAVCSASNAKLKEDEPRKKSKKRRIILDSDSDEDPLPSKKGSASPTKKGSSNNASQSSRKSSRKQVENQSSMLKATTSVDFFGSAPVVRNNKRSIEGMKKPHEDSFIIHEDEDFNKTLQQLDEVEKKKKKIKKEDKSLKVVSEMEFVKHSSKEEPADIDVSKNKVASKSDGAETIKNEKKKKIKKEDKSLKVVSEMEFVKHSSKEEPADIDVSKNKVASKSDGAETIKNEKKKKIKKEDKSLKVVSEMEFVKHSSKEEPADIDVSKNKVASKSDGAETIKNEKDTDKETLSAQKRREGYMLYRSFLDREGPKALGSKEIPEGEEGCLSGISFIITGILESIERDDAKALIEKYGGKVMASVTKNTKYVVVGRDPGPGKMKKAESFGTKQLDEDGLFQLIRTSPGKSGGTQKKNKTVKKQVSSPESGYGSLEVKPVAHELIKSFRRETKTDDTPKDKESSVKEEIDYVQTDASSSKDVSLKHEKSPVKRNTSETVSELKPSPTKGMSTNVSDQKPVCEMWVDKYKPASLKQVIGQQGDKSNAKKLLHWLLHWDTKSGKTKKPAFQGRWNNQDNGSSFKAALLSGPPGVGKTTTAQLVCKEAGFDFFELNASDTRSKKTLHEVVSELLENQTLAGCFKGGNSSKASKNHAIIMDEVDGMAGNEDRGGVQELISLIKSSHIPVICICNDRNHPKIRSLSNYCFDLRFQKPRVEQIKAAMMSITYKEGLKITPNVLQDVIVSSNQDIRQVLHNLSMWTAKDKSLSDSQAKSDIGKGTKHIKMSPFDVLREVFAIGNNSKATINDRAELFFQDYSIGPLFVQENYVHVQPRSASGNQLKHLELLSEAANSICDGDLVERQIRSSNTWSLLPTQAIFSSVIPGDLLTGYLNQMINFPAWLGKNSNRNYMDRILQELQVHMRMKITGNKTEVAMDYVPLLSKKLAKPLLEKEAGGIPEALATMGHYSLLREDFDNIIELSLWPKQTDPRTKINSKVKSAFTRAYNKECGRNPYSIQNVSKKKKSQSVDTDLLGEGENNISEEEEDDSLENDAMVKFKKPSKKTTASEDAPSTSKKGDKTSKRGRSKKK